MKESTIDFDKLIIDCDGTQPVATRSEHVSFHGPKWMSFTSEITMSS